MNIAVFHNLPSGGARRMMIRIIRELNLKNVITEYTLSCSSDYLSLGREIKQRKVYKYEFSSNLLRNVVFGLSKLDSLHKTIANDINRSSHDLVIVNHDFITKTPYILRYLKKPTIYFCHEPPREFYEDSLLHSPFIKDRLANIVRLPFKCVDRVNMEYSDKVISNSEYSKSVIKNIYHKNSTVIYPGVDTEIFKPTAKRKLHKIVSVGSLLPYKGHEDVIRALETIEIKRRPELRIIGDGRRKDREKIEKLSQQCNVKTSISHNISDEKLIDEYSSSSAVISLSHLEPFGMSVIEGMACGTPAVVVNEGGLTEQVIDNKTGFVTSRNSTEIGQKILSAIDNPTMGVTARRYVEKHWTWKNTISKLEKILYGEE